METIKARRILECAKEQQEWTPLEEALLTTIEHLAERVAALEEKHYRIGRLLRVPTEGEAA